MWHISSRKIAHISYRTHRFFNSIGSRQFSLPKDVCGSFPNAYVPAEVEKDWYEWWELNNYFQADNTSATPEKIFSMVLPPPNVTGNLHLGHALTIAIQDSMVRWNRMNKKSVTWFPGCDHAGIATQVIVEKMLKTQNLSRQEVGREKFLEHTWNWKSDKEEIIYQQLRKMGASLQWNKSVFTMDPKMCYAVNEAFIQLYKMGKIYRKERLVNWSCQLQSAISDIEVDHHVIDGPKKISVPGYQNPIQFGQLYQFAYQLSDTDEEILVSTTRPETIIGDVAIAVHPEDSRYGRYVGKSVHHPIRKVPIPVIADSKVDREFGTGALKITPGHDMNDFDIAERHGLDLLNIFDNQGKANDNCGIFKGMPRFELREKMIDFLAEKKLLGDILPHAMSIPVCSRSGDIIEPLLRRQWFVSMQEMASRAIEAVEKGHLKIHPAHFEDRWLHWLGNIKDWCISRQLWWGHQIPAYRIKSQGGDQDPESWVVAHSWDEAAAALRSSDIQQDEDVLDTWFSSSLFPFAVCGWPQKTADLEKLFPLDVMETGHDIVFFWVARMVMMSLELTGKLPFKEIMLHGIICDSQGRKMSKSLGNVIDPMDVIHGVTLQELEEQLGESRQRGHLSEEEFHRAMDEKRTKFPEGIPQIGADALRFTLCSYNVKNHFINLDMSILKRNRLLANKIWQATRFLILLLDRTAPPFTDRAIHFEDYDSVDQLSLLDQWIYSRLYSMIHKIETGFTCYDFHQATDALYRFLYGDLCDVYLEAVKPLTGLRLATSALVLARCLEASLRCLAPFMPYLSEELYQRLHEQFLQRRIGCHRSESILTADYPTPQQWVSWENKALEKDFDRIFQAVAEIRSIKLQYGIAKSKPKCVLVWPSDSIADDEILTLISTLAGVGDVKFCIDSVPTGTFVSRTIAGGSVHIDLSGVIDVVGESNKSRTKIGKLKRQLERLDATVSASAYVSNAPVHVQQSHQKKIIALREEIAQLENYLTIISELTNR